MGRQLRRLALAVVAAVFLQLPAAQASHTPDPSSVTIAGSLQSELGCPGDWQPDCATTHLAFDAEDRVWQGTFTIPAGTWEYKAALNNNWDENYGAGAAENGSNIGLTLAEPTSVKFYYDHASHWITSNRNAMIATAPGSYQSELGCPGDWQPDCLRSWLQDPDGDGTYEFRTSAIPPGDYEVKAAIDESWTLNYGAGGAQNGANIPFTVAPGGDPVLFSWNSTTHVLAVSQGPPPQPASVTVAGSLQSELGCSGDWQPDCSATHLTFDPSDRVWQGTFSGPGRHLGVQGGAQRHLGRELRRERDPQRGEHRPLARRRNAGEVLLRPRDALDDEQPQRDDCDRAGQLPERARLPRRLAARLPALLAAGSGRRRDLPVLDERDPARQLRGQDRDRRELDINYGAGGAQDGANISFTVPPAVSRVLFSWDSTSHVLTVSQGRAADVNLRREKAHWLSRDTLAWDPGALGTGATYFLHYAADGGLTASGRRDRRRPARSN